MGGSCARLKGEIMEEENNKNEAKTKKEISNKKAIIAIVSIVILLGICAFVYTNIIKNFILRNLFRRFQKALLLALSLIDRLFLARKSFQP